MINAKRLNELGFLITDITVSDSFIHDCKFYNHIKLDNLYLTDWDFRNEKPANTGLLFFFYKYKGISLYNPFPSVILNDTINFNYTFYEFLIEIIKAENGRISH